MNTDVLIIGAGLTGLSVTDHLCAAGVDCLLLEAKERVGGRIVTEHVNGADFDLGPTWFWPGQPRVAAMVERFELTSFEQPWQGIQVFQDHTGKVFRDRGHAAMQGSLRISGGIGALPISLAHSLPQGVLKTNTRASSITQSDSGVVVKAESHNRDYLISARMIVIAAPPRIVQQSIKFSPLLSDAQTRTLQSIPTWMAGQAKAIAIYGRPFWRERGLSGDGMSQAGPLSEIHDASPESGGPYALFGFIGLQPVIRKQYGDALSDLIKGQLGELFGAEMTSPDALLIRDWAEERYVATPLDQQVPSHHPHYGLPTELESLWSDDLILASAELDHRSGGLLEGALAAAERAVSLTLKRLTTKR